MIGSRHRRRRDPVAEWLAGVLPPLEARAGGARIGRVAEAMRAASPDLDPRSRPQLVAALAGAAGDLDRRAREERQRFDEFRDGYLAAGGAAAQRRVAAAHLRDTVSDRRRLRGDLRALRRHLDLEALTERHRRRLHELGRLVALCLTALRGAEALADDALPALLLALVDRRDGASPRTEAFEALCDLAERGGGPDPALTERIAAAAADPREELAIQRAATRLLLRTDPGLGLEIVERRLGDPGPAARDDFLYRAAAVRLLLAEGPADRAVELAGDLVRRRDPSEHVRACLARSLGRVDAPRGEELLRSLGLGGGHEDPSFRVRAAVTEAWGELARRALGGQGAGARVGSLLGGVLTPLERERHPVARQAAVIQAEELAGLLADHQATAGDHDPDLDGQLHRLLASLAAAARSGDEPGIALRAARALSGLRPRLDPGFGRALSALVEEVGDLAPEGRRWVAAPDAGSPEELERWCQLLAAAGQSDLGLWARPGRSGLLVQRGDRERRSLARLLHEPRHRRPDKRQGGRHTTLRRGMGTLRAPPLGLGVVTPTDVPGEPVVAAPLGSWGPHLPTVVDCLDAARLGRTIQIVHPHGTTLLSPPAGVARVAALWRLRWRLARLDRLRRRSLEARDAAGRRAWAEELERLGFDLRLLPAAVHHGDASHSLDGDWLREFFGAPSAALPALAPLAGAPSWSALSDQAWSYLASGGANSLLHLAALLCGVGALVLGDATVQATRIRRWRRSIPLVIGGWGTRGKSGTERLKTALFGALGYEVLSKTTGSESLLVHAAPGIPPGEIPLYRPYEKASIWEQRDVLRVGARMGVQVLLWECMAVTPRYVEILALDWMRDDLATITNCYPDHESIQGPAGRDVGDTVSRFVPRDATVVTAEREMLPLVRQRARERGSRCVALGELDAELLPEDLLARFPYREHPRNVALVARMAEELGIDRETAIVVMADHVIPDVGSLSVFPAASHRGRRITYVNGHAANDRTSLLASWRLGGMAVGEGPGRWTVCVINNRADRVARSRVFAEIVARDLSPHMICLIGTSLDGFVGSLRRAAEAWLDEVAPRSPATGAPEVAERLLGRLGLADHDPVRLCAELGAWLEGCGLTPGVARDRLTDSGLPGAAAGFVAGFDPGSRRSPLARALAAVEGDEQLGGALDRLCEGVTDDARDGELRRFAARQLALTAAAAAAVRAAAGAGGRDADLLPARSIYVEALLERTRPLRDPAASGDQVLDFLASQLPPGVAARTMGMQNIKGAALDFVHGWRSYQRVQEVLSKLERAGPEEAQGLLRWLREYPDHGVLTARAALAALSRPDRFPAELQPEAALVEEHLQRVEAERSRQLSGRGWRSGMATRLVESTLDHLHSIHRRGAADRILDDLASHRISHPRAAAEMRRLVRAQGRGWLGRDRS